MLVTFSGIGITEARGRLGDDVFTRGRGGAMTRAYVIPANTSTPYRDAIKIAYSDVVTLWNSLTDFEVELWNKAAKLVPRKTKLGHVYASKGRNLFIGYNMSLVTASLFPVLLPNVTAEVFPPHGLLIQAISPSTLRIRIRNCFQTFVVPSGVVYVVSCSAEVSAGTRYPRNNFKITKVLQPADNTFNLDIYSDYVAIYGTPTAGKRIFVRVHSVAIDSGKKSLVLTTSDVG